METFTLDCWVHGEDVERTFSVGISGTETVGALKRLIRNERSATFHDVEARDLDLYSIPLPDDLKDELKNWTPNGQPLGSQIKLSKLSPTSDEGKWLIIVNAPRSPSCTKLTSAAPDITLNYWVRYHPEDLLRCIQISSTDTVGDLQEAIKKKKVLLSLHNILVYKVLVSLPAGVDSLEGVLRKHTISRLGNPLQSSEKLSAVFMPLRAANQLHFIVDNSDLTLECWIRWADLESSFGVKISMKASVDELKNAIKEEHYCGGFDGDRLGLYKISVNEKDDLRRCLDTLGSGRLLQGNELLQSVFNDDPLVQWPRVVVELLDKTCSPSAVHMRLQYIQAWAHNPLRSPSPEEASNFKTLQSTGCRIECTRPPDGALTTPVTLLHPVFGQFVDDCNTHEPTSEDNAFVWDLSLQMSEFFEDEGDRHEAFINILCNRGIRIRRSIFAGYFTDGELHVNGRRYMILEAKSDSKGAEPYCQGILYYIRVSKDEVEKASMKDVQFNFPCLIVTLFGPHLGFSGAVWANRPNYQVLSTTLPLFWHPTDTVMRQSTARHIGAFMKACRSLQELYEKFDETPADFKDLQPEFPHPRCYTSLDGKNQEDFRYIRALGDSKLLFVVQTDAGEQLCIKFVRTYSQTVHQWCAASGMSPSLRGFNAIPGGWHMVVMDVLEEYERLSDVKDSLSREEKEMLREELRSKLTDLHDMNFVHGDVRDVNMMIRKDRSGWKLVDFDWSGKIGEVRYPMNVNRAWDLRRPEGALDGELILADHDIEMLDYLF